MTNDAAYWITLTHITNWDCAKVNSLVFKLFGEQNISIEAFFNLTELDWENIFGFNAQDVEALNIAKAELPSNFFLADKLENEGIELISIISTDYPETLKNNLKEKYAPTLLYIKGNKQILKEKSATIIGTEDCSETAILFTDSIVRKATKEFKVVVSGLNNLIDKQALDSSIKYIGQSIVVLSQGVLTSVSETETYKQQIENGDLLILSTFHPRAHNDSNLFIKNSAIICGLANEIYVAESPENDEIWWDMMSRFLKNRKIYTRQPEENETSTNALLIEKGAIPVNIQGIDLLQQSKDKNKAEYEQKILDLLKSGDFTANEIITKLQLSWTEKELKTFMKEKNDIELTGKKTKRYTIYRQQSLF
jgi:DNA processing protein